MLKVRVRIGQVDKERWDKWGFGVTQYVPGPFISRASIPATFSL